MKIEVSKVAEIIKHNEVAPEVLRRIIEEINLATQTTDDDKEPSVKKQFVVLVSDPERKITGDFIAWVLQMPEIESPHSVESSILKTAYTYNATRRGRLFPVSTVGEAIENIKAAAWRENDLWIKTKSPVLVIKSDNQIPKAVTE